ncbi:MAG: transposase [Microcoleaceae cyanobacterium]
MLDILAQLECLKPWVRKKTLVQWSGVITAMLAMSGRVTMLGISRWAGKGGSYRTVQRFFQTVVPWATIFWVFFCHHLFRSEEVYLLAGDEVVVTKAGKKTYGVERFFASLYGKSVSGLSFFAMSLVSVEKRRSFPVRIEQIIKRESPPKKSKTDSSKPKSEKNKGGRPKGSTTKSKEKVSLNPELLMIKKLISDLLKMIGNFLPLTYLLLDGHFGNNQAAVMARQVNLHLISKLRQDSALYFPYQHPHPERYCRRKYGKKLNIDNLDKFYLKQSNIAHSIQTDIYQMQLLHQEFAQPLNVVILLKTHLLTGIRAHLILFSTDLDLADEKLIDYYSLRFQIEFNFRDAKQFWGLEDFMNVSQTAVTNAANLSFFMVNLSHLLLDQHPQFFVNSSVIDLKAHFRGYKYVEETIKLLAEKPEPVLLAQIFARICSLGRVHPTPISSTPS